MSKHIVNIVTTMEVEIDDRILNDHRNWKDGLDVQFIQCGYKDRSTLICGIVLNCFKGERDSEGIALNEYTLATSINDLLPITGIELYDEPKVINSQTSTVEVIVPSVYKIHRIITDGVLAENIPAEVS